MANLASIQVKINEKIYIRNPELTELGRKIIANSVMLIDTIGFEAFTFRKLAEQISSTEASVYRYFENKHNLLVYLLNWYWGWLEYQLEYQLNNIVKLEEKVDIIVKVLSESSLQSQQFLHIDNQALHRIVVSESSKTYYTKNVDENNQDGFFKSYKSLCKKIADIVTEINPAYSYPNALSSTVLEAAHQQIFFSQHLPRLTDIQWNESATKSVATYLKSILMGVLMHTLSKKK